MKKRFANIFILSLTLALAACTSAPAAETESPVQAEEFHFESLHSEAEIDYVVPISVPNIKVNQLGYLPNSVKMAVFRGENLPEDFLVINAETGQTAYSGEIEARGLDQTTGEYISYGFFTDLTAPGRYYIEAQVVGRSYSFAIADNLYDNTLTLAGRQYYLNRCGISLTDEFAGYTRSACHTARTPLREDVMTTLDATGGWHQDGSGSKDVVTAAHVVSVLLLAYELHPTLYGDDTNIPESGNQIPDLLDEIHYAVEWFARMQDPVSGGVYGGVTVYPSGDSYTAFVEPLSVPATKMFCAVMAKFSYLYQGYDNAYATECLKAADRAWRYLTQNHTDLLDEMYFQAAAEMYRAAGYQAYHNVVVQYLNSEGYQNIFGTQVRILDDSRQEGVMLGAATYLLTRKRVDRNLCSEIMKTIMLMAEDITARARRSQYLTAGNERQDNNGELLADMFFLSFVNYIIPNHEYGTVVENHLHYLCGRNATGISYIDEAGMLNYRDIDSRLGIMNQIETNSKLYFMLSAIIGTARGETQP
jgi:endoglucanase